MSQNITLSSNSTTPNNNTMLNNATVLNSSDLTAYYGQILERSLIPGYVVLSFIISYIGSWTTLELINRRTSSKGLYNWSLLGAAAVSMGGIGIWCMHFIGNRAIVLGNGSIELQISYDGGITAISFFLPVILLFTAFAAVGANEEISLVRLGLGGTLAGLGVCGMHYVGQASVTNYDCIYYVAYVVGAALIAITAATAALTIFFVFRAAWNAVWWKRGICAIILSGAVSGMHWIAAVGTQYRMKQDTAATTKTSRNATTITVIVLSIGGCVILLVSALLVQRKKKRTANKAQQITLAAAVFDQEGKILVNTDGFLPIKTITRAYRETNFQDEFGISHPAFLWMYRVSRNWAGVSSLVLGMREHLHRAGLRNRQGAEPDDLYTHEDGTPIAEYSTVFREMFCAAAAELAHDMNHPVEKLGAVFDDIIYSGRKPLSGRRTDIEKGSQDTLGKGQVVFLVRVVGKASAQQLSAAGFRFAPKPSVVPHISRILQIASHDLIRQLEIMRVSVIDPHILEPGCHLALFAVRASITTGFDILVRQDARNLLPTMQLPFDTIESWQLDYLQTMNSQSVAAIMKQLNKASRAEATPQKEKKLAADILCTLEALKDEIEDSFFNDAMLVAKPVLIPCRSLKKDSPPDSATLIVFRVIIPIQSRAPGMKLDFTPLVFFRTQQHVYKNSPDHAIFARRAHREFAPVLNTSSRSSIAAGATNPQIDIDAETYELVHETVPTPRIRRASTTIFDYFGRKRTGKTKVRGDNSSEKHLVEGQSEDLGGIMVCQEVSVKSAKRSSNFEDKKTMGIELATLGKEKSSRVANNVSSKDVEAPLYVDELLKIAVQNRLAREISGGY